VSRGLSATAELLVYSSIAIKRSYAVNVETTECKSIPVHIAIFPDLLLPKL